MPMNPVAELATHAVTNQPPAFADINLFSADQVLQGSLEGAISPQDVAALKAYGGKIGTAEVQDWADQANKNPPILRSFDRYGQRLDEVEFHPAWHAIMSAAMQHEVHNLPWREPRRGALRPRPTRSRRRRRRRPS